MKPRPKDSRSGRGSIKFGSSDLNAARADCERGGDRSIVKIDPWRGHSDDAQRVPTFRAIVTMGRWVLQPIPKRSASKSPSRNYSGDISRYAGRASTVCKTTTQPFDMVSIETIFSHWWGKGFWVLRLESAGMAEELGPTHGNLESPCDLPFGGLRDHQLICEKPHNHPVYWMARINCSAGPDKDTSGVPTA